MKKSTQAPRDQKPPRVSSRKTKNSEAALAFTAKDIVLRNVDELIPFPNNPKIHNEIQISAIAANILAFGFDQPILVDESDTILKGHGRQLAARKAGVAQVPTVLRKGLSVAEKWAIVISDNALPAMTGFDQSLLRIGMTTLAKANFDLKLTGFDNVRLATFLPPAPGAAAPDDQPAIEEKAISKVGDIWQLGEHELRCMDCSKLKLKDQPRLQLADPPYEYATMEGGGIQAKRTYPGKMSRAGVDSFDVEQVKLHGMTNVFFTSKVLVPDYLNMAVKLEVPWDLTVMHRSAAMPNNATHLITDLDYIVVIGAMAPQRGLDQVNYSKMLSLGHWERPVPWAKPVEVLTKYIRLFSAGGDLVLDTYAGSGSTIIACAMEKRRCLAIELNPLFVDLTIRRWEKFSKQKAVLQGTKRTFDQVEKERARKAA